MKMQRICYGLILLLLGANIAMAQGKKVQETFKGVERIQVRTVSGDCIVKKGSSNRIDVDLFYDVEPEGAFDHEMELRGTTLRIRERWHGSSTHGIVTWTLSVPEEVEIEFSTASGELEIRNVSGDFEASTASGDILVENSKGEFEFNTASGEITMDECEGEFDLSTASGDIEGRLLKGMFEMSTASGDIDVRQSEGTFELSCASGSVEATDIVVDDVILGKTAEYDLELSSASGRVVLDYNGNALKGYFEFTARKDRGRIMSPFKFDNEEEFERNDYTYVRKSFTKNGGSPRVTLRAASGRVTLLK